MSSVVFTLDKKRVQQKYTEPVTQIHIPKGYIPAEGGLKDEHCPGCVGRNKNTIPLVSSPLFAKL